MDFIDNRKDKINFDVMGLGKTNAIFKNLDSDKYSNIEKVTAIKIVIDMETHNGITKDEILKAFNWLLLKNYIVTDTEGFIIGKKDGEIITGILDDLNNKLDYEEIVKHIISYILNKNDINNISSGYITLTLEDNDIKIKREKE